MDNSKNEKLKHDFLNSIVIVKSLAKSAKNFSDKITKLSLSSNDAITDHQIKLFQKSMEAICTETARMEITFYNALGETVFSSLDNVNGDVPTV